MRKEQQIRNNATGATGYVTVADSTTYETRHQPTSGELGTLKSALPSGYTWAKVQAASGSTYGTFLRGLIIGNSFTSSSAITATNWQKNNGMAASSLAQDYAHIIESALRTVNPGFSILPSGNGSRFEQDYNNSDADNILNIKNSILTEITEKFGTEKVDLVIVSLSENVNFSAFDLTKFNAKLDELLTGIAPKVATNATFLFRDDVWAGHSNAGAAFKAYAQSYGYKFADMTPVREPAGGGWPYYATQYDNAGVVHHPNDAGHAAIAELFLAQLRTSAPAPPPPDQPSGGSIITANQPWGGSDIKYIENDLIRVGFRQSTGATINHISLKSDNIGRVNDYKITENGTTTVDKGRQVQFGSDYRTPKYRYQVGSDNSFNHSFDTGNNTVQGGSQYPFLNPGTVIQSGVVSINGYPGFYAKVRGKIWGLNNVDGNIVLEENIWLEGRKVCYRARHTVEAPDQATLNQMWWEGTGQENPCIYLTGPHTHFKAQLTPGAGSSSLYDWSTSGGIGPSFRTAGHWVGAYDDSGIGLTLYQRHNNIMGVGYFKQNNEPYGDENGGSSAYLNGAQLIDYDTPGVYDDEGWIIVGTESQAMSEIASLPAPPQAFSFNFAATHQGWYSIDSETKREGDHLSMKSVVTRTNGDGLTEQKRGSLISPSRTWLSGNIRKVTVDFQVTGGGTQFEVLFRKPNQSEGDAIPQRKTFTISGNGSRQNITIDMSDASGWNGTISNIAIKPINPPDAQVVNFYSVNAAAN